MPGQSRRRAVSALVPLLLVAAAVAPLGSAVGAQRADAPELDPDTYACPVADGARPSGYVGFEEFPDGTPLSDTSVPGVNLSGWNIGDFSTGAYNGKFPAGGFSSEQTHWITAQGAAPTIGLDSPASTFSVLVASNARVVLTAFDAGGNQIGRTSSRARTNGRHMVQMQISTPPGAAATGNGISSVQLKAKGFYTVDSICTDAPDVPIGQIVLGVGDGAPGSPSRVDGYGFAPNETVRLTINGQDAGVSNAVDEQGRFVLPIVLPNNAQPGSNEIVATGTASGHVATANYLVHTDWVERGFSPGRTNENTTENTLGPGNVGNIGRIWSASVGGSKAGAVAVANGLVYVDSLNDTAYAFRENSFTSEPDLVWHVATNGSLSAAPAIDGESVFVASQDGHIYAFNNTLAHSPSWKFPAGPVSSYVFTRSPVLLFDTLYENDTKGDVFAIDKGTGRVAQFTLPGAPTTRSDLAVDNDHIYAATVDGRLFAYGRKTLQPAWTGPSTVNGRIHADPIVVANKVVIGSDDGRVYAFNTADGSLAWRTNVIHGFGVGDTLAADDSGVLFVGSRDLHGYLQARSLLTGRLLWEHKTGAPIATQPAVAHGVVYTTSTSGHLVAFAIAGHGKRLLDLQVDNAPSDLSGPVVANGAVYVGTGDGLVVKYGL